MEQNPQEPSRKRVSILGVPMDCVSMARAVMISDDALRAGRQMAIYAINPEKIASADARILAAIVAAGLLISNGIGAVLAARLGGVQGVPRVPGADIMPELCSMAALRGYTVFLYGGRTEITPKP